MEQPPIAIQFKTLPTDPGVYQYFDKNDTVIYVGIPKYTTMPKPEFWSKKFTVWNT
jgi:excinuclease ABC subunit C